MGRNGRTRANRNSERMKEEGKRGNWKENNVPITYFKVNTRNERAEGRNPVDVEVARDRERKGGRVWNRREGMGERAKERMDGFPKVQMSKKPGNERQNIKFIRGGSRRIGRRATRLKERRIGGRRLLLLLCKRSILKIFQKIKFLMFFEKKPIEFQK